MKFIVNGLVGIVFIIASVANIANAGIIAFTSAQLTMSNFIEDVTSGTFIDGTTWQGANILVTDNGGGARLTLSNGYLVQSGGTKGYLDIQLINGNALGSLQFDVSNGFGTNFQFLWIRTLNNGVFTAYDFDLTMKMLDTLSIISDGTDFDEIQIWVTNSESSRDSHNTSLLSAAKISNLQVQNPPPSTKVPEPASIYVFLLGIIGLVCFRSELSLKVCRLA